MLEKPQALEDKYEELTRQMSDPRCSAIRPLPQGRQGPPDLAEIVGKYRSTAGDL